MNALSIALALAAIAVPASAQTCFESDPPLATGGDLPQRVQLGDLDADGDLDMAVYNALSYSVMTRRNLGDGTWGSATPLSIAPDTNRVALMDVDGDGRADLVYIRESGFVVIRRSLGNGFAVGTSYSVPGNVGCLAGGDLDNDGDLDLVAGALGNPPDYGLARILRNQGGGSFVVEAGILANVQHVEIVDFDLDGDQDIVMANNAPDRFRVAINDGTGQFPATPHAFLQPMTVGSFTVADFDGDGRADLAAGLLDQRFTIQFSTLDGFSQYVAYPTPSTSSMTAGDLDDDGDVDLAFFNGVVVRVYGNAGNGTFALSDTVDVGSSMGGGSSGDLDGDGDDDLVVTLYATDQVQVLRNCAVSGTPTCFGDGSATACPCGNASPVGARAGCLHSLGSGGTLRASGAASLTADTVVLHGASMPNASVLYFQGASAVNGGLGTPFGDGLSCAGGSVRRLGTTTNVAGASAYPSAGQPAVSVRGDVTSPGERHYQVWYRNAASFCTPSTFNLTNSLRIPWRP